MNLGQKMAVFFSVAMVLLTLFCLLLKWFYYRMLKRRKQASERFLAEQQAEKISTLCLEGAYEEFCQKRNQQRKLSLRQSLIEEDQLFQQPELKKIFDVTSNVYSLSNLHRQLTQEADIPRLCTDRSLAPIPEFKIEKLNMSKHSKTTDQDSCFKFTRQLIRYNRAGINLLQVKLKSLSKQKGQVIMQKTLQQNFISQEQAHFEDLLESYGYDLCGYGCSQLICEVDVSRMLEGKAYILRNLDSKEYKKDINLEEYTAVRDKIEDRAI